MSVKFKDNSINVKKTFAAAESNALEAVGLAWQGYVSDGVPVDTGKLRQSMGYEVKDFKKVVVVGSGGNQSPVDYAPYVELGTSRMNAQPFLKPSIVNHTGDYERIVAKSLNDGMKA